MPEFYSSNDILDSNLKLSLDYFSEKGHLDSALINFADNDTAIPLFQKYSGKWRKFSKSYDQCNLPILKIKYEDIYKSKIENNFQKISQKISNFLETDDDLLVKSFLKQNQKALDISKNQGNSFFNKMKPFYFKEYFSEKAIKYFKTRYQYVLEDMGYFELL